MNQSTPTVSAFSLHFTKCLHLVRQLGFVLPLKASQIIYGCKLDTMWAGRTNTQQLNTKNLFSSPHNIRPCNFVFIHAQRKNKSTSAWSGGVIKQQDFEFTFSVHNCRQNCSSLVPKLALALLRAPSCFLNPINRIIAGGTTEKGSHPAAL